MGAYHEKYALFHKMVFIFPSSALEIFSNVLPQFSRSFDKPKFG